MTVLLIWVIAFALILYFAYQRWNSGLSQGLDKCLPAALKSHGDNREVWIVALAVLGATALVRPVEILLVAILLGLFALVLTKVINVANSTIKH